MENRSQTFECKHRYTFKKEELYQSVNPIFSKKHCEKCGKQIVLSRRSKIVIVMFTLLIVVLLVLTPNLLKVILPGVSYFAKGMVAVFVLCLLYGLGLYKLMNRATYVEYVQSHRYRKAYENARRENDERTRLRYEQAAMKRSQRKAEKK